MVPFDCSWRATSEIVMVTFAGAYRSLWELMGDYGRLLEIVVLSHFPLLCL